MATIVNELEAAFASVKARTEERDSAQTQLAAVTKEIEGLKAQIAGAAEKHAAELKGVQDGLTAEQTAHVATKQELETARKALANPAFAQAAVEGSQKAVAASVAPEKKELTFEEAHAEYLNISDPHARKAYRDAHKKELRLA